MGYLFAMISIGLFHGGDGEAITTTAAVIGYWPRLNGGLVIRDDALSTPASPRHRRSTLPRASSLNGVRFRQCPQRRDGGLRRLFFVGAGALMIGFAERQR